MEDIDPNSGIFIYPNPVSNEIFFEWDKLQETLIDAKILNSSGQEVVAETIRYGETLDVKDLSEGTYYLIMIIDNQHVAQKINITK